MSEYKRLTKKDRYGHWYTDTKINDRFMWSKDGKVWERDLSHYAFDGEAIDRLAELEDKIENGTLVETPCKVGDTVYEVFKEHKPPFIQETTIEKIVITEKGFKLRLSRNSVYETAISSLGRTVFLTKSEAETKLKELQEKQK